MSSINSENPYLSLVIPFFNEEENIKILYNEIRASLGAINKPYEIIFVDDGSSDRTPEILKDLKIKERRENNSLVRTKVIKFSRNFGQTAAMQAGFDFANGKIIVSMDGDLQNDPKDIPLLIDKLDLGYDLVCGWRKDRKDKALTRKIPSKIANSMIRKIIGVSIHDLGCSLKAYRSPTIKSVKLYSDMHRFIPVLASMKGARIAEAVVNHRPRKFGKAKYGLSRTWKVLFDLMTLKMLTHFQHRPFRWFAIPGVVFGAIGLISFITSIAMWLKGIQSVVFPAASLLLIFLFGSLMSWGLLAEYFITEEKR